MVYEKHIIWTEKDKNYKINVILWGEIKDIMQDVLKMKQTSLFSKYIKWISRVVFFMSIRTPGHLKVHKAVWHLLLHFLAFPEILSLFL